MATTPAQPITNVTSSRIYKPAISYQKKIDIEYNPNYGLGLDIDATSEYRHSISIDESATINPLLSNSKFAYFSNNTKNTGSNRSTVNDLRKQGFTKLDDVGPLPIQNMKAGNFNFTTGQIEYNHDPIIQHYKNILYDNAQEQISRPTYQTSANNKKVFSALILGESYPEFVPQTIETNKCTIYWVCVNDI